MRVALILVIAMFCACHSSRVAGKITTTDLHLPQSENASSGIIFITFKVTLADSLSDEYLFETISFQQTSGVVKKQLADENLSRLNFYCELQDANQKSVDVFTVPNPLNQAFEFSSEEGKLDKAIVKKQSAEFTIRFQRSARTKFLQISVPDSKTLKLKRIFHAKV